MKKSNKKVEEDLARNKKGKRKVEDDASNSECEEEVIGDDEEIPSSDEEEKPELEESENKFQKFIEREKKEHDEYFNEIKKNRVEQLTKANEEEDKVIAKYEKLLKLNRRKKNDSATTIGKFNDGLDYLLELCTDDSIQKMYEAAKEADNNNTEDEIDTRKIKRSHNDSDDEDDLHESMKKSKKLKKIEEKYFGDDDEALMMYANADDYSDNESSCDGSDSELMSEENEETSEENAEKDHDNNSETEYNSDEENENSSNNEDDESDDADKKVWEDIYGRKRDKDGNVIQEDVASKYVPPHLRKVNLKSSDAEADPKRIEKLKNLKRQIKGHINRLAESNLHRISIEIENIYNSNSRNDTNTVLTEIIVDSLVSNVLSKERLVLEHSLLIAILHANIGSEIGAFFLQALIEKFDKLYQDIDSLEVENKEIDNVVFIICHLFTFKLFKHTLIYELLEKLITKISEKRIECVLMVLKSIGFILRKEDPTMLKDFIIKSQKLLNSQEGEKSSRVSYMMNILLAIKNNNVTKIPQYDASLVDHFRKLLKQFIRPGSYVTSLAITMDDLLNADVKGKWWLVGSAWAGNNENTNATKANPEPSAIVHDPQREKIFALAKKQRMNTDAKRNVFYYLMTAEDYIDAFEKILSATSDERTIITVILHCCLSEKSYNQYYSVLAQKFCNHNRKYLLATQYAAWDKIKELKTLTKFQINNLSRFLIFLIENGNLPLSVLKIIEFAQIEKSSISFLRKVMLGLLLTKSDEQFQKIFERIAPSVKLTSFKDQLRLFLKVFLMEDDKLKISEQQMKLLNSRINMAEKFLSSKYL